MSAHTYHVGQRIAILIATFQAQEWKIGTVTKLGKGRGALRCDDGREAAFSLHDGGVFGFPWLKVEPLTDEILAQHDEQMARRSLRNVVDALDRRCHSIPLPLVAGLDQAISAVLDQTPKELP